MGIRATRPRVDITTESTSTNTLSSMPNARFAPVRDNTGVDEASGAADC